MGKAELGIVSVIITALAYLIYIAQTLKGRVQPHPFTWFIFSIVTFTGYLIQARSGAGAGSWSIGLTAGMCLLLGLLSIGKGQWRWSDFDYLDWSLFFAGITIFVFYLTTRAATLSAFLITATDAIGYSPTIKKRWREPWGDSVTSYSLNGIKFIPSLLALQCYSVATWLYPSTLLIANFGIAAMLVARRKVVLRNDR